MSFTGQNYDNAERTLFMTRVNKLPNGKYVYEILPFTEVNIDGECFFEPSYEPTAQYLSTEVGTKLGATPNKFVHIQVVEDNPVFYNPGGETPIFEKNWNV